MKFDATTSKWYQQIMESISGFFGLDASSATETDIHAALENQQPLIDQLTNARSEAIADLQSQFDAMKADFDANKTALSDLQSQFDTMNAATALKDERIAELQTSIADGKTSIDAIKQQHAVEINGLAGQLAAAKAGKSIEIDENDSAHSAGRPDAAGSGTQIIVATSDSLQALTKRKV